MKPAYARAIVVEQSVLGQDKTASAKGGDWHSAARREPQEGFFFGAKMLTSAQEAPDHDDIVVVLRRRNLLCRQNLHAGA